MCKVITHKKVTCHHSICGLNLFCRSRLNHRCNSWPLLIPPRLLILLWLLRTPPWSSTSRNRHSNHLLLLHPCWRISLPESSCPRLWASVSLMSLLSTVKTSNIHIRALPLSMPPLSTYITGVHGQPTLTGMLPPTSSTLLWWSPVTLLFN